MPVPVHMYMKRATPYITHLVALTAGALVGSILWYPIYLYVTGPLSDAISRHYNGN